jgi:hypothetical protein
MTGERPDEERIEIESDLQLAVSCGMQRNTAISFADQHVVHQKSATECHKQLQQRKLAFG